MHEISKLIVIGCLILSTNQSPVLAQNAALKDPIQPTPSAFQRIKRVACNAFYPVLHPKRTGSFVVSCIEHPLQRAKQGQENGVNAAIGLGAMGVGYSLPFLIKWVTPK